MPKNTVWRWEAGYSKPDAERNRAAFPSGQERKIPPSWKLEGSAELLGDLEGGLKILREMFEVASRSGDRPVAIYVTDTHPLIWYSSGAYRKLSPKARRLFDRASHLEVLIWIMAP